MFNGSFIQHSLAVALVAAALSLSSHSYAQNKPAPASPTGQTYTIEHPSNLPQGYVALISDYAAVNQKMRTDIAQGNGAMWRTWMTPGINRQDSLYWWLLADWLYQNKQYDHSYKIAVQAFVFTRMELAACAPGSESAKNHVNRMLTHHQHIIQMTPSQPVIRQSVLAAITQAENNLRQGVIPHGMSCYISKIENARNTQSRKKIVIEDLDAVADDKKKKSVLASQKRAIEEIKQEFSYNRVWSYSEADELWKAGVKE